MNDFCLFCENEITELRAAAICVPLMQWINRIFPLLRQVQSIYYFLLAKMFFILSMPQNICKLVFQLIKTHKNMEQQHLISKREERFTKTKSAQRNEMRKIGS